MVSITAQEEAKYLGQNAQAGYSIEEAGALGDRDNIFLVTIENSHRGG